MITKISSVAFSGIDIIDIDVQVKIEPGIPKFTIVGLADKTIAESKERVSAALSSIALAMPAKKILINLSPADLIKEGSHFDLPIAIGILAAIGVLPIDMINNYIVLGELSLDGNILPVNGVLSVAIGANARSKGVICSDQNGSEASWSGNDNILSPTNLIELINHFKGSQLLSPPELITYDTKSQYPDFKDIIGQNSAKRVLEIAAAGGHNLLMFGPPGSGKSMLAERLPGIMPELSANEILESSMISSIAGHIKNGYLIKERPFRSPHHSSTLAAMVGGGSGRRVKPGEISLAHNGVLFLDELPEFNSTVIESLRQPIETRKVMISRAGIQITYPANFQLVAAMNPCRCGYVNDANKACNKAPTCANNYQSKLSGPILDRFDLHIEVGNFEENYDYNQIFNNSEEEPSSEIAKRVQAAQNIQTKRYEAYDIKLNNSMNGQILLDYAVPVDDGMKILNNAANKFKLSMRAYNRILRVARTIADLDQSVSIYKVHIAEALSYRQMDYTYLKAA